MEIFIVNGSFGDWDDYHTKVLKVFDSDEKARHFQQEFENDEKIKKYKDLYYRKLWGGETDDDENLIPSLTLEEESFFTENHEEIRNLHDFNQCFIEKYIVE